MGPEHKFRSTPPQTAHPKSSGLQGSRSSLWHFNGAWGHVEGSGIPLHPCPVPRMSASPARRWHERVRECRRVQARVFQDPEARLLHLYVSNIHVWRRPICPIWGWENSAESGSRLGVKLLGLRVRSQEIKHPSKKLGLLQKVPKSSGRDVYQSKQSDSFCHGTPFPRYGDPL